MIEVGQVWATRNHSLVLIEKEIKDIATKTEWRFDVRCIYPPKFVQSGPFCVTAEGRFWETGPNEAYDDDNNDLVTLLTKEDYPEYYL